MKQSFPRCPLSSGLLKVLLEHSKFSASLMLASRVNSGSVSVCTTISNVNSDCSLTLAHSLCIYKANLVDNCVHELSWLGFSDLKFKLAAVAPPSKCRVYFFFQ